MDGPKISPHPHKTTPRAITLMGALQVLSHGKPIKIPRGTATSLFAYLTLYPDIAHRREHLVEQFWENAPPERGQRRLSNTLYSLQKGLGDGWLVCDSTTIALEISTDLTADVWEFEQAAKSTRVEDWHRALEQYRGDLLPEIYDDWVLARRVDLRDTYIALLLKVAHHAERHGELSQALEWYRRLATAEPLYEEGQRGVIRVLLGLERPTEALEHYRYVLQQLQDELGVPPAPLTQTLGEQAQQEVQSRLLQVAPGNTFARPIFVGRADERTQLLATLQRATGGQGGLALVLGEAGVGKSRLLEEIARAATWRGWQVAWGYGQELTLPSPYAPLQEALVAALPIARRQQLNHLVQPLWLSVIARAFPALATSLHEPTLHDPEFYTPDRLALAVQRLLEGLQQIAPHLLILDDVQWADDDFWLLLDRLREPLAQSQCLLLLAGRIEELQQRPERWAMVETWSRHGVASLTLGGLKATDLNVLVRTVVPMQESVEEVSSQLFIATNGNPLLALAMLQDTNDTRSATSPLHSLIRRRVSLLTPSSRTVLEAAAILGYRFSYDHLEKVSFRARSTKTDVLDAMRELEQRGMVFLETEGFRFQHDTLRRTIYEGMEVSTRQLWHRLVLATLREESNIAPTRLLHHAEQIDDHEAIGYYAYLAGQEALAGYAMASANHYFTRALGVLPVLNIDLRYHAILGRLQAENILGDRTAQASDVSLLREIADQSNNAAWRAEVWEQEAYYYWSIGAFQEAVETIQQGLTFYRQTPNPGREAALRVVLGRIVRERGQYHEAQEHIMLARTIYRQIGDKNGDAIATDLLGGIAWQMGKHQLGADLHKQAAEMFRANGNIIREAQALNNLGANLWSLERYIEARTTHERALPLCREQGHRRGEADNLDNMGGVAWILGDYEEAVRLYSEALTIRRTLKDRWGMAISFGNLGSAYRLWGKNNEALPFYAEALELNEALSRQHGLGYVLHGQGLAFLAMGDLVSAQASLERAIGIRATLSERQHWVESQAGLALVHLEKGDILRAETEIASALDELPSVTRAAIRQWVHLVAYNLNRKQGALSLSRSHLEAAYREMLVVAGTLPTDERAAFLERVPLNRQVQHALAEECHRATASLVAAHIPLGRRLTSQDYVNVTWTLYSPLDDAITNKGERRRHVLQRLITEASLQGATPGDEDLATALNVATRTIERDLATLTRAGLHLRTRRRK